MPLIFQGPKETCPIGVLHRGQTCTAQTSVHPGNSLAPPLLLPHKGSCQGHLPIPWPCPGPEPRM